MVIPMSEGSRSEVRQLIDELSFVDGIKFLLLSPLIILVVVLGKAIADDVNWSATMMAVRRADTAENHKIAEGIE
jgi:hypothetical protein